MKKRLITLPLISLLAYIILCGYADGPALYGVNGTGSVTGTTGCSCHNTVASPAIIALDVQLLDGGVPVTSYTGSHAYILRLTGTQMGSAYTLPKFGFQLAAVKTGATTVNAGALAGTATGTHLFSVGTVTLVEHFASAMPATTGTGAAGTTYVVDVPWTSPVAGTGSVTVFTVLNAVNNDFIDNTADKWNNTSLVIPESSTTVAPITGTLSVCQGATTTLSDATTGGTWSSVTTSVATVDATTGIVTGIGAGTSVISYTTGSGAATASVTVFPAPVAGPIGGPTLCVSTSGAFSGVTAGGTWSSSNTSIATIGSVSGMATGIATGSVTLTYIVSNSCGSDTATRLVTILPHSACATGSPSVTMKPEGLHLIPNPNNGTFTIELTTGRQDRAMITVTNIMGRKVKEFITVTNQKVELKLNEPAGLYFISARTPLQTYSTKTIIE